MRSRGGQVRRLFPVIFLQAVQVIEQVFLHPGEPGGQLLAGSSDSSRSPACNLAILRQTF
jgi:hypothetical protein